MVTQSYGFGSVSLFFENELEHWPVVADTVHVTAGSSVVLVLLVWLKPVRFVKNSLALAVPVMVNACESVCEFAASKSHGLIAKEDAKAELDGPSVTFAEPLPAALPWTHPRIGEPVVQDVDVFVTVNTLLGEAGVALQLATSVTLIVLNGR